MAKLTPISIIAPIIYPPVDSTTAIQLNKADGITNILNVDTTNSRLGIGTTSPLTNLEVSPGGNADVRVGTWSDISGNSDGRALFATNFYAQSNSTYKYSNTNASIGYAGVDLNSGIVRFLNASGATTQNTTFTPTETMRITAAGNVGIGTITPGRRLDILDGSNVPQLRLSYSATKYSDFYTDTDGVLNIKGGFSYMRFQDINGNPADIVASGYRTSGIYSIFNSGNNSIGFALDGTADATQQIVVNTRNAASSTYLQRLTIGTKADIVNFNILNANVGIGVTGPTAKLHLVAGTATANTAPLKFNSGTLLTTAEAGAIEFLTDAFYGTITTGAARKTFAFLESPTFTGIVTAPTVVSTAVVRLKGYTVATLPAGTQGDTAYCTDLLAPTFFAGAVGGGAVVGPVFYNGTQWITI